MTDDLLEKKTRETADAIWNQNGKHSHVMLDDVIRVALKEYGDARAEEALESFAEFCVPSVVHNQIVREGIKEAFIRQYKEELLGKTKEV